MISTTTITAIVLPPTLEQLVQAYDIAGSTIICLL